MLCATKTYTFSTSQLPKVVRTWCALNILTSRCASRHNGVHFFDISTSKSGPPMVCFVHFDLEMCFAPSTSKSGPNLVCFVHFDLEMCFAPQRRALFRQLNFQKWSGAEVLWTFRLGNVLRATTACNFSSLIWPAGSAPAALASYFSTLRGHKSLEKHSASILSYLFAHLYLLSSETFSFLIFFLLLFSSLL